MDLEQHLASADVPQRDKLEHLRARAGEIRALDDAAFTRIVRAIKKKLSSPKLADEVAAFVRDVTAGRDVRPSEARREEPPDVAWVGSADLDVSAHAIEAAIAADPDAQGPYTVLGDYWASINDPRGELVAIGHALAKNPAHKAMRAAWTQWMAHHARALWGKLGGADRYLRDIDWYMGFIRACTVNADYRVDGEALVSTLLDEPGPARFVQRLALAGSFELAKIVARRPRPTLRTLALGHPGTNQGDISMLWPAIPKLRELRLEGSTATVGDPQAPMLERFAFDFGHESEQPIEPLAPLWSGTGLPRLRAIAFTNSRHTDALCAALVDSPLAAQLEVVDFGEGTMTAEGAALLIARRDRFPRMKRWEFELNYLTEEACAQLRAALPGELVLDDQREDDGHRHGADWE